jgi:hypothetical protein
MYFGKLDVTDRKVGKISLSILISLIMVVVNLSGCVFYRSLLIVKKDKPVTLFDRYELDIWASWQENDSFRIILTAEFIDGLADETLEDTIPKLVIASLCFKSECIDSLNCVSMKPAVGSRVLTFDALGYAKIPITCQWATMRISARLHDRVTGEEIARESKEVRLYMAKGRGLTSPP